MSIQRKIKGFTLIELAVVLFIVALLLGALLTPLGERVHQQDRTDTQGSMQRIEEALYGFAVSTGRMPCPDCQPGDPTPGCVQAPNVRGDGLEDRTGAPPNQVCAVPIGNVPWRALGVGQLDAWGNPYTYSVTPNMADGIGANTVIPFVPALGACAADAAIDLASFELCTTGGITIQNQGSACPNPPVPIVATATAVAVVVSHGRNSLRQANGQVQAPVLATQCNELENHIAETANPVNDDGVFVFTNFSNHATLGYDDLIIWINPNVLKSRMLAAGKLP